MRIRRVLCPVTLVVMQSATEVISPSGSVPTDSLPTLRSFTMPSSRHLESSATGTSLHRETDSPTMGLAAPLAPRLTAQVAREPMTVGIDASREPLGSRPFIPAPRPLVSVVSGTANERPAPSVRRPRVPGLATISRRMSSPWTRQRAEEDGSAGQLGVIPRGLHAWASARHQPLVAQTRRSAGAADQPPVAEVTPEIVRRLAADGSSGVPLPDEHRIPMESVIGADLRHARIHTGDAAAEAAEALEAEAFTVGSDVFFGRGRYDPTSVRGRALLAHELVHVRQQTTFGTRRILGSGGEVDSAEAEAQAVERAILEASLPSASGGLTIGNYERNYTTPDGQRLSSRDVARLDAISIQAIEVCKQLLGAELSRVTTETIEDLQVEVSLDLSTLSDDEATHIWGRALAEAIRARRANAL